MAQRTPERILIALPAAAMHVIAGDLTPGNQVLDGYVAAQCSGINLVEQAFPLGGTEGGYVAPTRRCRLRRCCTASCLCDSEGTTVH